MRIKFSLFICLFILCLASLLQAATVAEGISAYEQGQTNQARTIFADLYKHSKPADAQYPEILLYYGLTRLKASEAIPIFEKIIGSYPREKQAAQAAYQIGNYYSMLGSYRKANQYFSDIISQYARFTDVYSKALLKAGETEIILHEYEMAERRFQAYLDQFPQGPHQAQAYLGLGVCSFERKDYRAALPYFQNALEKPGYEEYMVLALFRLGETYEALANYSEAIKLYQKVRDYYPSSNEALKAELKIIQLEGAATSSSPSESTNESAVTSAYVPQTTSPGTTVSQDTTFWSAQVGAWSVLENAEKQQLALKQQGYIVQIVPLERNGKPLYKVVVGQFASSNEASQLSGELNHKGIGSFIVELPVSVLPTEPQPNE